jgi:hypothetical protein
LVVAGEVAVELAEADDVAGAEGVTEEACAAAEDAAAEVEVAGAGVAAVAGALVLADVAVLVTFFEAVEGDAPVLFPPEHAARLSAATMYTSLFMGPLRSTRARSCRA